MSLRRFVEKQRIATESLRKIEEEPDASKRAAEQLFYDLELALKDTLRKIFHEAGYTRCAEEEDRLSLFFSADDLLSITVYFETNELLTMRFEIEEHQLGRVFVRAIADEQVLFFAQRGNEPLTHIQPMSAHDAIQAMFLRVA